MYESLPSFVLGFHGCDATVAEAVFAGKDALRPSENAYDWLGHGAYFWESNPSRALDYARDLKSRPLTRRARIRKPAVIGAVIDLGSCLNLLDHEMIELVRQSHAEFVAVCEKAGIPPLRNEGGPDLLKRFLDCAVIEHLHTTRSRAGTASFDSVRGVFVEGRPIYPDAGFHEKSHIQICVRNPACIKGCFRVREPANSA